MTSTYVALFSVWLHAIQIYFRASNTVYTVTFKGRLNPRFKLKSYDSRKSTTLLDKVPHLVEDIRRKTNPCQTLHP